MLRAEKLVKQYNHHQALKGIDLNIQPGEIYCLLGANGAGKSTTINIFLGFIKPSGGQAFINGMNVVQNSLATRQYITYIPENLTLYPHLTGFENLRYFCKLSRKQLSKETLEQLLTDVGLQPDFIHQRIAVYSKGMRQKVGIALAIAKNSKVLLLDEPTSGLDPKASNEFSALLLTMQAKGTTILMATHDIFRAKETGNRIGIMKNGSLVDTLAANDISANDLEKIYLQHMHD